MWYTFDPTKVRRVSSSTNQWTRNSIIVMAVVTVEALIAGMQLLGDALRTSFNHTVAQRYSLNRKYLLSPVLSTDKLNTLGWILSLTLTVQLRIWMSLLLLLSLAVRPWFLPPAQNQDIWPREWRRANLTGYPHINLVPCILETTGRPGPHARKFICYLMRDADNPPLAIRDTWSDIQRVLHSAISRQQLTAAVT